MRGNKDNKDKSVFVPIPIAIVLRSIASMFEPYWAARPSMDPPAAMRAAMKAALSPDDLATVLGCLDGDSDALFPDVGPDLAMKTQKVLEDSWVNVTIMSQAPAEHRAKPSGHIVDLAEWMATNPQLAFMYYKGRQEEATLAERTLTDAIRDLVEAANAQARTRTGRKVKLEQAQVVVQLLGDKSRAVPNNKDAAAQTYWCDSLLFGISGVLKGG
jgi:hypothetical protein